MTIQYDYDRPTQAVISDETLQIRGGFGPRDTSYRWIRKVVHNPFRRGDAVRIGNGRKVWRVQSTDDYLDPDRSQFVRVRRPADNRLGYIERYFEYARVSDLTRLPDRGITVRGWME